MQTSVEIITVIFILTEIEINNHIALHFLGRIFISQIFSGYLMRVLQISPKIVLYHILSLGISSLPLASTSPNSLLTPKPLALACA